MTNVFHNLCMLAVSEPVAAATVSGRLVLKVVVVVSKAAQGKTEVVRQPLDVAHDHMGFGCLIGRVESPKPYIEHQCC